MFIFIGGVLYSLDPPNAYRWGGQDPPDPPPPRESTRLLEDVLEAKDVLEDSTSAFKLLKVLVEEFALAL